MSELQEHQVSVGALEVGMYVCRLDRPWSDTPFPLAGFRIASETEIEQLNKFCRHVFVEVEAEGAGELRKPQARGTVSEDERAKQKKKFALLRRKTYEARVPLEEEVPVARKVHGKLHGETQRILSDLEAGHAADFEVLREHVEDTVESIIRNPTALMLLVQLEKSDSYTYNHALGTSVWCAEFGRHLGLEKAEIQQLALGGLLLDVGKTKLPRALFSKETFGETDWKLIRTHVQHSVKIVSKSKQIDNPVMQMVATHHERHDGTGYPEGLAGDDIPLFGQIAGLVDSYDAMTTKRPYMAQVRSPHQAISEVYGWRDSLFEGELIEQFIQTVGIYPAGSLVELSSGEVGMVVSTNSQKRLCPSVLLMLDPDKKQYPESEFVNLAHDQANRRVTRGLAPEAYDLKFEEIQLEEIHTF